MSYTQEMREDRRSINPVFNNRKLKLGTFQTNLDYGCLMSDIEGRLKISWPNTVALAKLADEMEFEALLPVARWRGFGGKLNPQGPGFETYHLGLGHRRLDRKRRRRRDLALLDQPSDRGGEARRPSSIISPTAASSSTSSPAGTSRRSTCSAPRCCRTTNATTWPRNGLRSSNGCGPKTTNSITRASTTRSSKAICSRSRSSSLIRPIMNAGGSERGRHFAGKYCDSCSRRWARRTSRRTRRRWTPTASWRARNMAAKSRSGRRRTSFRRKPKPRRAATRITSSRKRATGRR